MNITLKEYNTVIDGLRVQLELQRKFHEELRENLKTAEERIERKDETIELFRKRICDLQDFSLRIIGTEKKLKKEYDELEREHVDRAISQHRDILS